MKKQNQPSKQYYSVKETFTSRTDIDPILKLVLINIFNKLRIPARLLERGFYTFSASNVAKEMGLGRGATFYRFKMLEHIGALKHFGYEETRSGSVALYKADIEIMKKLASGEIKITDDMLKLARAKKDKENGQKPDEVVPHVTDLVPHVTHPCHPGDTPCSPRDTSNQIDQTNIINQRVETKEGTGIESSLENSLEKTADDDPFGFLAEFLN
jgi:hypothetical protein